MLKQKIPKKVLLNAPSEWCFWVSNGWVLKNLLDLRDALSTMNDQTFNNHVNDEKNDFAKWIEGVLGDAVFARKLRTMRTRKTALRSVSAELKKYQI